MSSCDEGEKFEVEAILDHKVRSNGRKTYKIHWKGYPLSEATWEKAANLDCDDLLTAYWDTVKAKKEERKNRNRSRISVQKQNKRRRNTSSSEDNVPTVNMEGVFDIAPSTPPPIDDEELAGPPPKKKSKPNEKEESPSKSKKKHKKKSKRERSKSRDPDEPSTSSSKSKKKDKKKKKDKHRDRDEEGSSSKSSSKKSHHKEKEASDSSKSKEKSASTSPNINGARVPPLIIIMSDGSSNQNKDQSASSSDKENVSMKAEPMNKEFQCNENENESTTDETSPFSPDSSSPITIGETSEAPPAFDNQISSSVSFQAILKNEESELSDGFPAPSIVLSIDTPNVPRESSVSQINENLTSVEITEKNDNNEQSNEKDSEIFTTNNKQPSTFEATATNSFPTMESSVLLSSAINDTTMDAVPEQQSNVSMNLVSNDVPCYATVMHPFTPEFVEQPESPLTQQPIISPITPILPPSSHKCFGNSPSVNEFAKNATIHNINHHQIMYVLSKIWKVRCLECTGLYSVTDNSVEYAFALLEYETKNYFLIKIKNCLNELFLMEAEAFKAACPQRYGNFVADTREYFETLGDLGMAIDEQKNVVASHHENDGILHRFNNDDQATFQNTSISYESEKVRQAIRDIVNLFILELQFDMGSFMAKQVDSANLKKFVMHYYDHRDQMYIAVKKEFVEQNYEHLYIGLIPKPSNS